MSEWYYRIGDQEYGPIPEKDLRKKIESGELSANTHVFRNGLSDWLEAGRCKELTPGKTVENQDDFPKPEHPPDIQTGSPAPSRNRILYWCLGIIFAGVLAAVLFKASGSHAGGGLARRFLALFNRSEPSAPSLEQTRNYWLAIQKIKKPADASMEKLPLGHYPMNYAGQFDLPHFSRVDFENLRAYYVKKGKIARGVTEKIEGLPIAGVDPGLLHYELELSELWALVERVNLEFAGITRDMEEQKICFESQEAYALRFGKNNASTNEMDARNLETQRLISDKIKDWRSLSDRSKAATDHLARREEEIKTLLKSRYNSDFK